MIAPLYTRVDASHAISKRLLTEIRTATRGFALCLLEGFFSAQHTGFFGLTPLQCHEWEQVARNSRGNIVRNLEGLATFVEMLDQAMGGVGHHLNEVEKEIVVFGARNGGDWEWADWTKRKDGRLLNTFY